MPNFSDHTHPGPTQPLPQPVALYAQKNERRGTKLRCGVYATSSQLLRVLSQRPRPPSDRAKHKHARGFYGFQQHAPHAAVSVCICFVGPSTRPCKLVWAAITCAPQMSFPRDPSGLWCSAGFVATLSSVILAKPAELVAKRADAAKTQKRRRRLMLRVIQLTIALPRGALT